MFRLRLSQKDVYEDSSDETKRIIKRDFLKLEPEKFYRVKGKNILLYKNPRGYFQYWYFDKNTISGMAELNSHTLTPDGSEYPADKFPRFKFPLMELYSRFPTVSERKAFFSRVMDLMEGKEMPDIPDEEIWDIFNGEGEK